MAGLTLSGRVYLDTNIFIYALEGYPTFRTALTTLFDALDRQELTAVTSAHAGGSTRETVLRPKC